MRIQHTTKPMKLLIYLILASLIILSSVQAQENDNCSGAINMQLDPNGAITSYPGSTAQATVDSPPSGGECGNFEYVNPGVWYSFTTEFTRTVEISTCNQQVGYDTQLTVFKGNSCSTLSCIANNDDRSSFLLCSDITFVAFAGERYYILVHGSTQGQGPNFVGDFRLDFRRLQAPNNDFCDGARSLVLGASVSGSTVNATLDDPNGKCAAPATYDTEGVWFSYRPTQASTLKATTCFEETNFDTQLSVFEGNCDSLSCVAHNEEAPGQVLCSEVTFPVAVGSIVYILLHGFDGARGSFRLLLDEAPTPSPTPSPPMNPTNPPTRIPTASPTASPTKSPTKAPTLAPSPLPTTSPASSPTASPVVQSTSSPTASPTPVPSSGPTNSPTPFPTTISTPGGPSNIPTSPPTGQPTGPSGISPTPIPSVAPTSGPTTSPTPALSSTPNDPTSSPVLASTGEPTEPPTPVPSPSSAIPSPLSTLAPTSGPTGSPTPLPTPAPGDPTSSPTLPPTSQPTEPNTPVPSPASSEPDSSPMPSPSETQLVPTNSPLVTSPIAFGFTLTFPAGSRRSRQLVELPYGILTLFINRQVEEAIPGSQSDLEASFGGEEESGDSVAVVVNVAGQIQASEAFDSGEIVDTAFSDEALDRFLDRLQSSGDPTLSSLQSLELATGEDDSRSSTASFFLSMAVILFYNILI